MSGIPRSASVIARGQSGKAGHAIAVRLRGSTNLGSVPQKSCQSTVKTTKQTTVSLTELFEDMGKSQKEHNLMAQPDEEK
uniref:Uncharacterized protein n=1 Tax=Solanum lycopersicum TaxID=4081 RepID=A0A3Q7IY81_SOLLC